MIQFDDSIRTRYGIVPATWKEDRERFTEDIRQAIKTTDKGRIELCVLLLELYQSKTYAAFCCVKRVWSGSGYNEIGEFSGDYSDRQFLDFCVEKFDIERSEVSRLVNIASEFADLETRTLQEQWQDFSYSQLVEMLPLTDEQRKNIKPDWTIKAIRKYKKELVATSQQTKPTVQKEKKEPEEVKSKDFFATYELDFSLEEYQKYAQFLGLTPKVICDKYLELEMRYSYLESELDKYKSMSKTLLDQ